MHSVILYFIFQNTMIRKVFIAIITLFCTNLSFGQYESFEHKGEVGIGIGGAQYFGDLNPYNKINQVGLSGTLFYLHNFNNYFGAKLTFGAGHLGYDDLKNKRNYAYYKRNLSFNDNVYEFTLSGSFNFFNFIPGIKGHRFTPYMTLGIGVINYNPYTYLDVNDQLQKVYLRPLGTEGQKSDNVVVDGKSYKSLAAVFPLTFGFKYAVTEHLNVFTEFGYRFTTTDYLDDVSTTYAGLNAFTPQNYKGSATNAWYARALQDRSSAIGAGNAIGTAGQQRGKSAAKDSYLFGQIGISININGYKCPTAD